MSSSYRPMAGSPPTPPSRVLSPSSPSSPPHSRTTSLRALELAEFPDDGADRPPFGRTHRSSTITSLGGFDFREGLLPLTLSGEEVAEEHGEEKHVGMLHGRC
jgi:hypothetical protein